MVTRRKDSSKTGRVTHEEKLNFLSQFKRIDDPTNKRSVSAQYNALKRVAPYLHREASPEAVAQAKKRGFFTTEKGIVVDGPRDGRRNPIPGAKFRLTKDGTAVWSVNSRRDFIVGLTRAEKKEFAKHPSEFVEKKLSELRETIPTLRGVPRSKIQVRLQWGAYQGTKDFSPNEFARLTTFQQFRAMHGVGRKRKASDVDRLTGLHIVVHLPKGKSNVGKTTKKRARTKAREK